MIAYVAKLVATAIASRSCPVPVAYAKRLPAYGETQIVFSRPRAKVDISGPPATTKTNPPRRAQRGIVGTVRVYARSTLAGARTEDHEDLADQIVDFLIVALQSAAATIKTTMSIGAGGFLTPAELEREGLEAWPGVVYELPITVQRGVFDRTWEGEAAVAAKPTTPCTNVEITGACVGTVA